MDVWSKATRPIRSILDFPLPLPLPLPLQYKGNQIKSPTITLMLNIVIIFTFRSTACPKNPSCSQRFSINNIPYAF